MGHDRSGYDRNDGVARRDERLDRLRPGIEERDILRKSKATLSIEKVDGAGENNGNPDRPKMNGNQAGDIAGAHARKPPRADQGNEDGKEGVSHAAQTLHEEVNEPKDGKNDETREKADGPDNRHGDGITGEKEPGKRTGRCRSSSRHVRHERIEGLGERVLQDAIGHPVGDGLDLGHRVAVDADQTDQHDRSKKR